jgi:hypothetical protein
MKLLLAIAVGSGLGALGCHLVDLQMVQPPFC